MAEPGKTLSQHTSREESASGGLATAASRLPHWPLQLQRILASQPCVLVTLNLILGSTPREPGCRMLVTADHCVGSIGGGNLEYSAIRTARDLLQAPAAALQRHQPFGLGPALNQCCGGAVVVHWEKLSPPCPGWVNELASRAASFADNQQAEQHPDRQSAATEDRRPAIRHTPHVLAMEINRPVPVRRIISAATPVMEDIPEAVLSEARRLLDAAPADLPELHRQGLCQVEQDGGTWWLHRLDAVNVPLTLFGAGHVGQEVARLLERLPFNVRWVDERPDVLPAEPAGNVLPVPTASPLDEVAHMPPSSICIVMTHSHSLDEDLCHAILQRNDFCWLGLIGSQTKRRRFVQRLGKRGISEQQLQRLVCPIGLPGIHGKHPATIALALVAQLMMEKPWTHAKT